MSKTRRLRELEQKRQALIGWPEVEAYSGHGRKFLLAEHKAGRLKMAFANNRWTTTKAHIDEWLDMLARSR